MSLFLPFLKIFPILLAALMFPGPNFVLIGNLVLAQGHKKGLWCAAGMATIDLFYASLSLAGLGVLLEQATSLATGLKILGGGYLAYIGLQMWLSTLRPSTGIILDGTAVSDIQNSHAFKRGFFISLTNPKVVIFYGSLFTLALNGNSTKGGELMLPVLCTLTSLAWYGSVSLVLSHPRIRTRYEKMQKNIDRLAGWILIIFGLRLVCAEIWGLLAV